MFINYLMVNSTIVLKQYKESLLKYYVNSFVCNIAFIEVNTKHYKIYAYAKFGQILLT